VQLEAPLDADNAITLVRYYEQLEDDISHKHLAIVHEWAIVDAALGESDIVIVGVR
jgi:hypothetical protein